MACSASLRRGYLGPDCAGKWIITFSGSGVYTWSTVTRYATYALRQGRHCDNFATAIIDRDNLKILAAHSGSNSVKGKSARSVL